MSIRALLLSAALLLVQGAMAQSPADYQTCAACHGAEAQGNPALGAPALAGQDGAYLLRQLQAFKSGERGAESPQAQTMAASVATLKEEAMAPLSDWLAQLAVVSTSAAAPAGVDLRKGENLYNANCGACHGASGQGNALLGAPRLAGLDAAYMTRQYAAFQSGKRGNADRFGKQMAMMAKAVGDKGLTETLAWLATQSGE